MKVYLIRHGLTQGNLEGRYIGCRTDEPLCEQGINALKGLAFPEAARVYVSPMLRCVQTATLLYPKVERCLVQDFRECDFGLFEGKNYAELDRRRDYQAWIDSGGELPFPGGESRAQFAARCVRAFDALDLWNREEDCAVVAHGGTVMAIMEAYARPRGRYFDFQLRCGEGYALSEDGSYQKLKV